MAKTRSKETGKKLLVIGDPDNGFSNKYFGSDYGCGDLCVDLIGCNCPNQIKSKIETILPKLQTDSYVIYISCVLEYVDNNVIDGIITELKRVGGKDVFIVTVDPYSLTSIFYFGSLFTGESGAKRRIFTSYPFEDVTYENL
jgi:hypothetical protein